MWQSKYNFLFVNYYENIVHYTVLISRNSPANPAGFPVFKIFIHEQLNNFGEKYIIAYWRGNKFLASV